MPILPAEPDLYPPDLWDESAASAATSGRWWCLHTKPRQEKATARHLHAHKLTYFLPQAVQESRTPRGRKIRSVVPLFAGYVFFRGNENERVEALKGNTLVRILDVPDQDELVRDLKQIMRILSSGRPIVAESTFVIGDRVRIAEGPLSGLVGTVESRGKGNRFQATVHFLGRGVFIDLEDWQVEPAADGDA